MTHESMNEIKLLTHMSHSLIYVRRLLGSQYKDKTDGHEKKKRGVSVQNHTDISAQKHTDISAQKHTDISAQKHTDISAQKHTDISAQKHTDISAQNHTDVFVDNSSQQYLHIFDDVVHIFVGVEGSRLHMGGPPFCPMVCLHQLQHSHTVKVSRLMNRCILSLLLL